ncbi:MAG: tail fiber domain-containing protein [Rhizobiales bacterium]|nr:tail fiber domain-containing protein [Hyphomicrobiales bacterium]
MINARSAVKLPKRAVDAVTPGLRRYILMGSGTEGFWPVRSEDRDQKYHHTLSSLWQAAGAHSADRLGPLQTFLRIGAAIDFTPETTVRGRSSLGFDHEGRIKGNVDGRFFVGFGVELPAGIYASDRRLKKNVLHLGEHSSGLKLCRYRYVWGDPDWIGVIAQEVATTRPDAVVNVGDYLAVDYTKLGIRPIAIVPETKTARCGMLPDGTKSPFGADDNPLINGKIQGNFLVSDEFEQIKFK